MSAIIELKKDLLKLERYTKKHLAFCSILSQKTIELEALASSISNLSKRWVESENGTLDDTDALLFRTLVKELTNNLDTIRGTCGYLNAYATETTSALHFFLSNNEINNSLLDFLIRLNEDHQALHDFLSVADALKIAVNLLCSETLSPRVKISKSDAFGFRALKAATTLICEGANKARSALNKIKSDEKWQSLEQSIKNIDSTEIQAAETKQENDASLNKNHAGTEEIFKK